MIGRDFEKSSRAVEANLFGRFPGRRQAQYPRDRSLYTDPLQLSLVLLQRVASAVDLLLRGYQFQFILGQNNSFWRPQNNIAFQDLMLTLFTLLPIDHPSTTARYFICADTMCLAVQGQDFSHFEDN